MEPRDRISVLIKDESSQSVPLPACTERLCEDITGKGQDLQQDQPCWYPAVQYETYRDMYIYMYIEKL